MPRILVCWNNWRRQDDGYGIRSVLMSWTSIRFRVTTKSPRSFGDSLPPEYGEPIFAEYMISEQIEAIGLSGTGNDSIAPGGVQFAGVTA